MSPQRAFPRRTESHDVVAGEVLERHAHAAGWAPTLPVPIELIIDATYHLRVDWEDIDEPPGERILGYLRPLDRLIMLNLRHEALFDEVVGPLQFTLAHELGHWLYDADDPAQGQLFDPASTVFCRRLEANDPEQIREVNANKLASALLMPAGLVKTALTRRLASRAEFNALARDWGVSRKALRIRLETLGLDWCLPEHLPA